MSSPYRCPTCIWNLLVPDDDDEDLCVWEFIEKYRDHFAEAHPERLAKNDEFLRSLRLEAEAKEADNA